MRQYQNNISSNVRNITLNLKNITSHFIGKKEIITLSLIIIILSFANITLCLSNVSDTSALSYSSDVNIGFTFNPTISLSISPGNLTISNLTPGTAAESNTITVNVATNTAYGYHLTANVGSDTTNYNIANLVHATSATTTPTSNATFASLAYGSKVVNKDSLSPNTWGYSYSNDSGTTWQPYSGLPLYSDTSHSTELISTYDPADSKSIDFKIAANANNTQPSGEYTNIINFYAVTNSGPPLLYDLVEDMTKGTLAQNNVNLSDPITQANSGVYTYDPAVYGVASDALNDYPIYFYRGILDTDAGLGTYGSDGQADAWPNYVKLNNGTCWRIVRTTGSGGVKMIYNGVYKNGTCANSGGEVKVGNSPFNSQHNNAVYFGYTYNSNMLEVDNLTSVDIVFGSNANIALNDTRSTAKTYIEDTWYANNMTDYTSLLESGAGYCNDRMAVNRSNGKPVLETNPQSAPWSLVSSAAWRNFLGGKSPSLTCPRGEVDVYSYLSGNGGVNFTGNELKYPAALLTADEASLAGSGNGVDTASNYSINSFLSSGTNALLMSPYSDYAGMRQIFTIYNNGSLYGNNYVSNSFGVRSVISLMHHIQVMSGNGTATSPWTISE